MAGERFVVRVDGAEWCVAVLVAVAGLAVAAAQDTRQVKEPAIPSSCVQLSAQLRAMSDKVAEADESKLDTARI